MEILNSKQVRAEFPGVTIPARSGELVYLDSAASALKPLCVIERLDHFYKYESSNVHRGAHFLSDQATGHFEAAREEVAGFLGAAKSDEIIFTRGTTESINLVASSYGEAFLHEGDEIILSMMEHHSNIVPWQMLAEKKGLKIKVIPIDEKGDLIFEEFEKLITERTKFLSLVHCSNTLGTINDVERYIKRAHEAGAKVLIDGAQSAVIQPIDVQKMDADFFAFSGHKLFGPYGIGVLYGKAELLSAMPPYQGGGSMIQKVSFEGTTFNEIPFRFEAGTPHVAGAIGLQSAIKFVHSLGWEAIQDHEARLIKAATEGVSAIEGIKIIGQAKHKSAILSFTLEGAHPSDLGNVLDQEGVAVRSGHHCTQPLMEALGVPATVRASFSIYNTLEDVDRLVSAIKKAKELFE